MGVVLSVFFGSVLCAIAGGQADIGSVLSCAGVRVF
jgi:hypothetical protein